MKCYISIACVLSVLVAVSLAAPLGSNDDSSSAGVQILDNVIQSVTSQLFRVVGRAILQNGGLGGGSSGSSSPGKVSVVLPTFPPDDYDEDEEEEQGVDTRISDGATTEATPAPVSENNEVEGASEDSVAAKRHVRRTRDAEAEAVAEEDQDTAASGGNAGPQPAEDLANVEDADRNKRYLPFQGATDAHAGAGGSGNFLFDIIRGTADNAARAVGTVYRMVAGTENLGIGLSATSTQTKQLVPAKAVAKPPRTTLAQLIAGSGATEEADEKEHAAAGGVAEIDLAKAGDGYTEGIPGPITRLFVIANRGIANLVQDLILRLAQTSERIVNFKFLKRGFFSWWG